MELTNVPVVPNNAITITLTADGIGRAVQEVTLEEEKEYKFRATRFLAGSGIQTLNVVDPQGTPVLSVPHAQDVNVDFASRQAGRYRVELQIEGTTGEDMSLLTCFPQQDRDQHRRVPSGKRTEAE